MLKELGWSFWLLGMLINEFEGCLLNDKNECRRRRHSNGEPYFFFHFVPAKMLQAE